MSRKSVKTRRIYENQSLAASFNSDWINITQLDNVGVNLACNSVTDNTGTFAIEVRLKQPDPELFSEGSTLTLSSVPTLANAAANFFINLNQLPADQFRVVFTAAGGTPDGTLEMFVHSKTMGG
jgi:hypothetical protein